VGHLTVPADLAARSQVGDEVASHPPADLEILLAQALHLAAVSSRWEVVAQLTRELEARRTAALTNVPRRVRKPAEKFCSNSLPFTNEEREG
jgi:hypothetical protein